MRGTEHRKDPEYILRCQGVVSKPALYGRSLYASAFRHVGDDQMEVSGQQKTGFARDVVVAENTGDEPALRIVCFPVETGRETGLECT